MGYDVKVNCAENTFSSVCVEVSVHPAPVALSVRGMNLGSFFAYNVYSQHARLQIGCTGTQNDEACIAARGQQ